MRLYERAVVITFGSVLTFWILHALLLHQQNLQFDIEPVASFLEMYGTLYGVTFAFALYVVWSQFNSVQSGIQQEADLLEDIYRMTLLLSDQISAKSLAQNLRNYVEALLGSEWMELSQGKTCAFSHDKFMELCYSLRSVPVTDVRDQAIYAQLLEAVNRLTRVREERVSASLTRIPKTLWLLLNFMSAVLLIGFLLLFLISHSQSNLAILVGTIIIAFIAFSIGLLLSIIKDIDNPFVGVWNVSPQPFRVLLDKMH
ncbi:DUF4239 domain-containing protein [Fervidibacter sacchari]|jgi:hypothetical protein|uniref:Uncharacterized membrane protein (DUF485 family) n=1 Tax=Candidatus Fervidibacter sacchari TaxID=1448929 RepID=A0ABT2EMM8_9BACT|nr:DUF4239 domain-containing protein [Candidatus Fervidibacter sacchari]MCS3918686.1 uncharacterized membrane protein (DUF485 family) [Candidatus Fervidibacter sacchari]WKU17558.1 DUF4239 domain-containing protein [Candidatus Fervidibacter sacchari]